MRLIIFAVNGADKLEAAETVAEELVRYIPQGEYCDPQEVAQRIANVRSGPVLVDVRPDEDKDKLPDIFVTVMASDNPIRRQLESTGLGVAVISYGF